MHGSMSPPPPPMDSPMPTQKPHVWPSVIGIISIILALIGLIAGILYFLISPSLFASMLPENQRAELAMKIARTPLNVALTVIGLVFSLWLIWGSVLLLRRRKLSRPVLNYWGVLSIVLTIISTILVIISQMQVNNEIAIHESNPTLQYDGVDPAQQESSEQESQSQAQAERSLTQIRDAKSFQNVGTVFGNTCGGVFQLIWPILVLCFMNTSRNRATINSWP